MVTRGEDVMDAASAREKCIKLARKQVEFEHKWGRWPAAFYIAAGATFVGFGFCFAVLLQRVVQIPGNPGPPVQNAVWQDFSLGIIFGVLAGGAALEGILYIAKGIQSLRGGDQASHIIVEYHDALVALMHDQTCDSPTSPDTH